MADEFAHHPVLLEEALDALDIKVDGCFVDCTFGRGGHSRAILNRLGPDGRLLAIDQDPAAVEVAKELASADRRFSIERGSFSMLQRMISEKGWNEQVDGILLDLGVSSPQLDDAGRGFSFLRDGPLDMRMDPDSGESAAHWLASVDQNELARVLKIYGEERFAKRISRAIVQERAIKSIDTTVQLAEVIEKAGGPREKGKHPATRSFQGIRIFINRELEALEECLHQSLESLTVGGRLTVISFHSLEDRIVKRFIREQVRGDWHPPDMPIRQDVLRQRMRKIGKIVKPGEAEISANPRARSAVLRAAERVL